MPKTSTDHRKGKTMEYDSKESAWKIKAATARKNDNEDDDDDEDEDDDEEDDEEAVMPTTTTMTVPASTSSRQQTSANGRKRKASDSSSAEFEPSAAAAARLQIEPDKMLRYVESLMKHIGGKSSASVAVKRFRGFSSLEPQHIPNGLSDKSLRVQFNRYLALAKKELSISAACTMLIDFLNEPKSVELHPDFPRKPFSVYHRFTIDENKRLKNCDFVKRVTTVQQNWSKDKVKKDRMTDEWMNESQKWLTELDKFLEKRKDILSKAHVAHINALKKHTQAQMRTRLNENNPDKSSPSKMTAKNRAKHLTTMTAFEVFKMSKVGKYSDLTPEQREQKLRRRFDKLDEEKLEEYKNIASSLAAK